nr:uncharacterized protein LOC111420342 [Onthophagus taurus]
MTQAIYAITRAQSTKINTDVDTKNVPLSRLDRPGVVELIKRPKKFCLLRIISEKEFMKETKNRTINLNKKRVVYQKEENIMYLLKNSRSSSALEASVRELLIACKENNVKELTIIKDDKRAEIREILWNSKELNKNDIKLTVVKNLFEIYVKEKQQIILNDYHMLPTGGHAGINRMFNNIKKTYFWSGLRKDIEAFVKKCDDCQKFKHSKHNIEPMSITTKLPHPFKKFT